MFPVAPPSAIVEAIQATGRDAILRGSGLSNSEFCYSCDDQKTRLALPRYVWLMQRGKTGAAVCILETWARPAQQTAAQKDGESDRQVRGLARVVEVSSTATLIDLTVRGLAPGTYHATIREFGNLKDGASSTGPVWSDVSGTTAEPRGQLGTVQVDDRGRGSFFISHPVQVWEVIGHAMVVSSQEETAGFGLKNDDNTVVGVIARSAGMWDNDKTVCSCTGKTLWEERGDLVRKGMV